MDALQQIPAWVNNYIELPYLTGGRTRAGLDCWGLVRLVYREVLGVELPEYEGPAWHPGADAATIAQAVTQYMPNYTEVPAGQERLFDGILLRMRGVPLHVGLVVVPGWMLHVYEGVNVCLEDYRGLLWKRRVLGFHRHG